MIRPDRSTVWLSPHALARFRERIAAEAESGVALDSVDRSRPIGKKLRRRIAAGEFVQRVRFQRDVLYLLDAELGALWVTRRASDGALDVLTCLRLEVGGG